MVNYFDIFFSFYPSVTKALPMSRSGISSPDEFLVRTLAAIGLIEVSDCGWKGSAVVVDCQQCPEQKW